MRSIKAAPPDVFITEALALRPSENPDHIREKLAIQALATAMANEPEQVLPRLVSLAMELTSGSSAGVSLLEPEPAPGIFRWCYLSGVLAKFEGAETPRNFSPCGVTLDQDRTVLSAHPERVYDWIAAAEIVVPEVLLVPLRVGSEAPMGTLWIVSDMPGHFNMGHVRVVEELATFVSVALQVQGTRTRLQGALEQQETLTREMGHRVKNLFAMMDGMVRQTARNSSTKDEMAKALSGRLHALASAHSLVRPIFRSDKAAIDVADLEELIRAVVRPHETSMSGWRVSFGGPAVATGERSTNGMALAIHELATNSAKYGALSLDQGRVSVRWRTGRDRLFLEWRESNGPLVKEPPSRQGFGTSLMKMTIERQFGGAMEFRWRETGLEVALNVPLAALAA